MKFVEEPWLPQNDCNVFIIDLRASFFKNKLNNLIFTKKHKGILPGIDSHPDMNVCHLGGKYIVVSKEHYSYYNELLSPMGFDVICGENDISDKYPYDIAFNCVLLNKRLFHNLPYTDKAILNFAEKNNYELINVKQGYTKCSTLIADENSVITSDYGLYKIYSKYGIDVLFADNKTIKLENFNNGFIGGAGGLISKQKMAFFGNITEHPDYNNIREFLEKRNIEIISLSLSELTDYGSIIPLIHI